MRAPWRASSSFSTCRCSGSVPECRKRPSKSPRRIILRGLFAYRVVVISRYGSVAVCGRISGFRGDRFCICEKRINFEDGGGHPRPLNRNPMATKDQSEFKYLVANDRDRLWGITVTSVGFQRIDALKTDRRDGNSPQPVPIVRHQVFELALILRCHRIPV